jgi:hypothetical protein
VRLVGKYHSFKPILTYADLKIVILISAYVIFIPQFPLISPKVVSYLLIHPKAVAAM